MNSKKPEELVVGIKEKLANLEQYLPEQEKITYDFARFLSNRAHDRLEPEGFNMMAKLALYDLQTGEEGYTRKPIQNELVGYPPAIYYLLGESISQIAEAIFGKEYGHQVEKVRQEARERAKDKVKK